MTHLEYGIPPEPASVTRRLAVALIPYAAVLVGLHLLSSAWTAILLYHAGMMAVLLAHRPAWTGRLGGWHPGMAVALALMGALAGEVLCVLWTDLGLEDLRSRLAGLGLRGPGLAVFLWYLALFHPWLEECTWRGVLFTPARGPAWEDVLFAGYHVLVLRLFLAWPWVAAAFVSLAVAAWIWRRTVGSRGGIAVPLVSHLTAEVAVVLAVLDHL